MAERSDLTNSADNTGDTSLILEGKHNRRDEDRDPEPIKQTVELGRS